MDEYFPDRLVSYNVEPRISYFFCEYVDRTKCTL